LEPVEPKIVEVDPARSEVIMSLSVNGASMALSEDPRVSLDKLL
jgi:hypothetical protein